MNITLTAAGKAICNEVWGADGSSLLSARDRKAAFPEFKRRDFEFLHNLHCSRGAVDGSWRHIADLYDRSSPSVQEGFRVLAAVGLVEITR